MRTMLCGSWTASKAGCVLSQPVCSVVEQACMLTHEAPHAAGGAVAHSQALARPWRLRWLLLPRRPAPRRQLRGES